MGASWLLKQVYVEKMTALLPTKFPWREDVIFLKTPILHPFRPLSMSDIQQIIQQLVDFRNQRDWEQFHNPKDLALAISVEAAELLELFLWKAPGEANREKVKEELADVLAFAFLLAERYGFDIKEIMLEKIARNGEKYPIEKAKGTARKYNEL